MSISQHKSSCRACGNVNMQTYLKFGDMPLSNNLENSQEDAINAPRFPLEVDFCDKCFMSQINEVIDPEVLFGYYTYRSSINGGYREHCKKMAISFKEEFGLNGKSFVIDIAGNDGALLKEFQDVLNCKSLNVDPAKNLCEIAEKTFNVKSFPEFWNLETALKIHNKYGKADLITATNVFAHVDDIENFLQGVKIMLKDEGVLVLEFPYLVDLIERNEFDTVYFEHLSYLGIHPVKHITDRLGFRIFDIEKFTIHGGTVRVKICHENSSILTKDSVTSYLENEASHGYGEIEKYLAWSKTVEKSIYDFSVKIRKLKSQGKKIAGFAASAKGNTLLNSAKIDDSVISFIADETPEKIGKFSPGTGIPIVHIDTIREENPDYIVILSWNFKHEIIEKLKAFYDGKFIIPIPNFRIDE
jgi:SAM-dependent methyltransferase